MDRTRYVLHSLYHCGEIMALTAKEKTEIAKLRSEIISEVDKPKEKIYAGCVIRNSDPDKVARLKELGIRENEA